MAPQRLHPPIHNSENNQLPSRLPAQRVPRRKTQQPRQLMHPNEPRQDMPASALPHHHRPREPHSERVVSSRPSLLQASLGAKTLPGHLRRLPNPSRQRQTQQSHQHHDPKRRTSEHERC